MACNSYTRTEVLPVVQGEGGNMNTQECACPCHADSKECGNCRSGRHNYPKEGHLSRWMVDQCDLENEGDRLAMEQYEALIEALTVLLDSRIGNIAFTRCQAALKAAEGE